MLKDQTNVMLTMNVLEQEHALMLVGVKEMTRANMKKK